MLRRTAVAMVGLSLTLSCVAQDFNCQDAEDCGRDGQCEPSGYCSFPDTACPSGQRYGDLAGAGLAGECVNPIAQTESSTTTSETSATSPVTSTTTSTSPPTGSTTAVADGSSSATGESTDTTTGPASTTSSTTDGSGSSSSGPGEPYSFFDDFARADGAAIGNGWVEDNPPLFSLLDGEVVIDDPSMSSYENNLVYRPLAEAIADVELAAVVRFDTDSGAGIPQIFGRVQSDVRSRSGVSAYLCFYSSSGNLVMRRNNVAVETDLAASGDPIPYTPSEEYRLRLRIEGADPVELSCAFEVLMGENWSSLEMIAHDDDEPDALVQAGSVGFSTHVGPQPYRYDDFYAVDISLAR